MRRLSHDKQVGFTLIELSIALVIIGLLVGGVLVGRDLVSAAGIRAQVSQIERLQSIVNTFKTKYNYLPGDIASTDAANFGFAARSGIDGHGDGNGVIQGACNLTGCNCGFCTVVGETGGFWNDLSVAKLINGAFNLVTAATSGVAGGTHTNVGSYLPEAAIGSGLYIYIWSGGTQSSWLVPGDGINYFGLSAVVDVSGWHVDSNPGLTVAQASAIDSKIDDGMPQSGRVMAWYFNYALQNFYPVWASGGGVEGTNTSHAPSTTATAGTSTTCYDNSNAAGAKQQYSITQSKGTGVNCALSFKFQ